ncbi:ABC transporter ATP-binding protein [Corynebacterium hindlerae]|uniref:ABC transporter ATP-binding protein n=1 Tax=Corynebacterium hindlerae TaxID=699041 RepID=UPI003AAE1567
MASLTAHNINIRFGTKSVLEDVTLSIAPGEIVGLIGASGSGKTTLGRILTGRYQPTAGHVTIDDVPLKRRDPRIATIHQSPRAATNPGWTLTEIIREPLDISGGSADIMQLAQECFLSPELLERTPEHVSDGQLQRACIARAFAQQPRYLVCDEPTSALDPIATAGVIQLLTKRAEDGSGVLLISHDHRLLAACAHRVVRIDEL